MVALGERLEVSLEEVRVNLNQFAIRYAHDFAAGVERPDPSVPAVFQDVKLSDFAVLKASAPMKSLRIYIGSLETDLRFVTHLRNIRVAHLLKDESSVIAGFDIAAEAIPVSQTGDEERSLVVVRFSSLFRACRCTLVAIDAVEVDARLDEVADAPALAQELGDYAKRQEMVSVLPARSERIKVSVTVQAVKWTISAGQLAVDGVLEEVAGGFLQQGDETVEISMTIEKIAVRNASIAPGFRDTAGRWVQPSKMSAHYVFSQAEVNIDLSIIAVDARLFDGIRAGCKQERSSRRGRPSTIGLSLPVRPLASVSVSAPCFPAPAMKEKVANGNRSPQMSTVKDESEGTMMWR
jgi:hypothetical protein